MEPRAIADSFEVIEGVTTELDVLANDQGADGNATLEIISLPAVGAAQVIRQGTPGAAIAYTAPIGERLTALNYRFQSGPGVSNVATAMINVAHARDRGGYANAALAMAPYVYYRLGEAAGATVMLDSSGASRNGSYVGAPALGQAALCREAGGDRAAFFSDPESYGLGVEAPAADQVWWLSLLFRVAAVGAQQTLIEADVGQTDDGWSVEVRDKQVAAYLRVAAGVGKAHWIGGTGGPNQPVGWGQVVPGRVHWLGLRFGTGGAEIWLDGAPLVQDTNFEDLPVNNGAPIVIGSYHGQNSAAGVIDEVLVFQDQLSEGEIAKLSRTDDSVQPPVAQNDPVSGRHAVSAGGPQRVFDVLANDFDADDIVRVGAPSPNLGSAVRIDGPPPKLAYTPPDRVARTTEVDVRHTVRGPAGTAEAALRLLVNPAASGPWCTFLATSAAGGPMPTDGLPGYLGPACTDPLTKCRAIRVAGDAGKPIPNGRGSWHDVDRHAYSKTPFWNADMSLCYLARIATYTDDPGDNKYNRADSFILLDGTTYAVIQQNEGAPGIAKWHPTRPDRMIYVQGSQVGYYFPKINKRQVIRDFQNEGYAGLRLGTTDSGLEAQISNDGDLLVLVGKRSGKTVAFAYKISENIKFPDFVPNFVREDKDWNGQHFNASPNGDFLVRTTDASSSWLALDGRSMSSDSAGLKLKHQDLLIDDQGRQYVGGIDRDNADFVVKGPAPSLEVAFRFDQGDALHVSGRCYRLPNWAFLGMSQTASAKLGGEIVMVNFITGEFRRLFRGRAIPNRTYLEEMHPCPSPDGKRFVYASNWDASRRSKAVVVETCDYLNSPFA
jgi:hypothetical protein